MNKKNYIIGIFIFTILLYLYRYYININYQISNNEVSILYELFHIITCELEKNNIEYIIIGGTLLGSIRHDGLIPWDDDIDIAIINKTDDEIYLLLRDILQKYGLTVKRSIYNTLIKVISNKSNRIILDVFPLIKSNEKYQFLPPYNTKYKNEWFYENELYPLKQYIFGGLIVNGPNNPINYLNRSYPNWESKNKKWNSIYTSFNKSEDILNYIPSYQPDNYNFLNLCKK
jgi:phosphorylcholine metabolism protein LicD